MPELTFGPKFGPHLRWLNILGIRDSETEYVVSGAFVVKQEIVDTDWAFLHEGEPMGWFDPNATFSNEFKLKISQIWKFAPIQA